MRRFRLEYSSRRHPWSIPWPPGFPEGTSLDIFFSGYVTDLSYAIRVSDIDDLNRQITEVIGGINAAKHLAWNSISAVYFACHKCNSCERYLMFKIYVKLFSFVFP